MKICFIVEGSYPYVMGGVSSWVHTMIKSCPEHEFIIYSITSEASKKGQYKYELPNNVIEIMDVFLDDRVLHKGKRRKSYRLKEKYKIALQKLIDGGDIEWSDIFEFFSKKTIKDIGQFLMSYEFFEMVQKTYNAYYAYTPFTEFVWTIRSMYITLFYILLKPIPKADIYHSMSTGYAGVIASYGKYLNQAPFILSEHGIYTREREEEIIKSDWIKGYHKELWIKFFVGLSKCAYDRADQVTALFEGNKTLQVELGCPQDKIQIIPNGIDVKSFESLPSREDEEWINIGTVARIVPIKDIKTMLTSFEVIKRTHPKTRLYIMGPTDEDSEYYEECKNLQVKMGVQDIYFTGAIKVLDYIHKMDILWLTSLSEGQPLALMEGMCAKKPHVCTNVGHCKGLLEGEGKDRLGVCGYIAHIMDTTEIAQLTIKLCEDKKLRQKMGEVGYNRIRTCYTKASYIKSYKQLYLACRKEA